MPSPSLTAVRQTLQGTAFVFAAEALVLPTGLVTAAVLTRYLGPADYGLLTLVATVVAWVQWTIAAVFSRAAVKFVSDAEDWMPVGTAVIWMHLATSAGAAVLLALLAPLIAGFLHEPMLTGYVRLLALDIVVFSLAHAHRSILIGIGAFKERALGGAGRWITRMVLIVVLVTMGLGIRGAILGSIGASLVELAINRYYARAPLFAAFDLPFRKLWSYAGPLALSALSLRLFEKLDLFVLKVLGGTAVQAGFYGAAQNLSLVPGILALSLSPLLLSTLSRTMRAEDIAAAKATGRIVLRMVVVLLPFAGMSAGAAKEVVTFIFGATYLPAAPLLAVLIFGSVGLLMISVTTAILIAAEKPGWTLALTGPMLPAAAVGHLLLIPRMGSLGASLVTTSLAWCGALAALLAVHRVWRIAPPASTVWRSALIACLAAALALLWATPGLLLVLKLALISVLIPVAFLLLGEFSAGELARVRAMLRRQTAPERSATGV